MRRVLASFCLALGLVLATTGAQAAGQKFTLTSPDVKAGATIDNKYVFNQFGCKGDNVSPALSWSGAPHAPHSG
jgi:phosphatidylethanolamine-binding protein (PEBP) family uncharacterized protein